MSYQGSEVSNHSLGGLLGATPGVDFNDSLRTIDLADSQQSAIIPAPVIDVSNRYTLL